jgi:putative DNA primase/helicase
MKDGLFDAAKARILSDLEHYFPDGESRNGEWWWRRRDGDKTPSCHCVGDTAAIKDFGDDGFRGSVLDAYAESRGMSALDAAKEICPEQARERRPPSKAPSKEKEKAKSVYPVPEGKEKLLNTLINSQWAKEKYGDAVMGSKYLDAQGRLIFTVIRFENSPAKHGGKDFRPFYFGDDGKWHQGDPFPNGLPLYGLHDLAQRPTAPVLVVEGEKCQAAAEKALPEYVCVTWSHGSSSVDKTDWAPLAGRDVTIWPDADAPGLKAAIAIRNRLPGARVLNIEGKEKGWDIADAIAEGIDPAAFMATCPTLELPGDPGAKLPFSFLGYSDGRYHFLPRRRRVPFTIDMGQFSPSRLLELAPLNFWGASQMIRDNGAIKTDTAQDWIIDEQEKVGMVDLRRLRGAGVWRDGEAIVVNDGAQIVTMAGERLEYDAFHSTACAEYIPSETRFGDMTGEESTDAEGAALAALFDSLKFLRKLDPVAALGWALIAPFGGLLKWRPHLWITGRRSTGKSTVLIEKMIDPLLGEFAFIGSGRSSEPSIRRGMNLTARPGRFDEFDPGPRAPKSDLERMGKVIVLARNSSCDSTAMTTLASGDTGNVTFVVRSCFLFASINLLEMDSAIESRVVRVEKLALSKDEIRAEIERMKRDCAHVMTDPSRYRRRIFRAMPRILEDIDAVHPLLMSFVSDARQCDVIAPILAAAWAVQSAESVMGDAGRAWVEELLDDLIREQEEHVEDEDRVIEHILQASIRTDDLKTRTVSELLARADSSEPGDARETLERNGLKIANIKNGDGLSHRYLAIPQRSDSIARMLSGTPYESGYDQQIQRHELCKAGEATVVRMAHKNTRCRCLDWDGFRRAYLGAEGQGRLSMEGGTE